MVDDLGAMASIISSIESRTDRLCCSVSCLVCSYACGKRKVVSVVYIHGYLCSNIDNIIYGKGTLDRQKVSIFV